MTGRQVDLVVDGRIATLAGAEGLGWVEALAISDGVVVAAGPLAEVEAVAGAGRARRLRLAPDEVAIPGLTDAHLHLADAGITASHLDLTGLGADEARHAISGAHRRLPPGAWLEGHGWDVDRWGRWPTTALLDDAAPGRPAAIWAHDHHALWTSSAALERAGIDESTPDPPGGLIRRDPDGRPTGVLHEAAAALVDHHVPAPSSEVWDQGIQEMADRLHALGVVGVHDPGSSGTDGGTGPAVQAYRRLAERGDLVIRVHVSVREEQLEAAEAEGLRSGMILRSPNLVFGWLKLFADGTLGSRTAALLEPWEPEPDRPLPAGRERGVWLTEPERLAELARRAAGHGIATQIHAIGDAALRAALDALEPNVGATALLPRVEHVQLADPADVRRFAASGVAASVQPIHLRSDAAQARRLWGARAERGGYPWGTLVRSGATLAFGTDAPVEPIDPWPGLELAVTRRSPDWDAGTVAFGPDERMTLAEALRAQCIGGPASAREDLRGRLVPGSPADLAVVPSVAFDEPVEPGGPLGRVRPRLVLVGGVAAFGG